MNDEQRTDLLEYQLILTGYAADLRRAGLYVRSVPYALSRVTACLRAANAGDREACAYQAAHDAASTACDEAYSALKERRVRGFIAAHADVPGLLDFVRAAQARGADVAAELALLLAGKRS